MTENEVLRLRDGQHAIYLMCYELLGAGTRPEGLPVEWWCSTFPTEVILYALLETQGKLRRTPGMTTQQIANFASSVMERKSRDDQRRNGRVRP